MKNLSRLRPYRKGDLEARKAQRLWDALIHLQKDPGYIFSLQQANIWAKQLAEVAMLERLGDKLTLFPRPRKLHQYKVQTAGTYLGEVFQEVTSSHRKAGRIIMRTWHPIRWGYRFYPVEGPVIMGSAIYHSRKDAIQALCYQQVIQEG